MRQTRIVTQLTLFAMALVASVPGYARDYIIDVVVFENIQEAKRATPGPLYIPRNGAAIGLDSDKAKQYAFTLVEDSLSLSDAADKIRKSGNYRLLKHFAWRQPGLDNKNAKAIRINMGKAIKVYVPDNLKPYGKFIPAAAQPQPDRSRQITTTTVNGNLKVRLGRFLHLDANLVFTDTENARSYRLSQSRKMRSREYHYIDNPRFGLLVRILPVEGT